MQASTRFGVELIKVGGAVTYDANIPNLFGDTLNAAAVLTVGL